MTVKLLREIKPDYLAFCFDRKEKSFRFDMYSDYKANREDMPQDLALQVPYLKTLTDELGIPRFDQLGFEADDVIGSLTSYGLKHNWEVVIVSGDKDFAQLVGPFVSMYDTMKDKKYDQEGVLQKWGVLPHQMVDYLAIVGDSSDNIPGVRGIGPKGAEKLLSEYKTLDGIYENLDKIASKSIKTKLMESKDKAYLSRSLVTIVSDLDFQITPESLRPKEINKEKLGKTLEELSFKNFERSLLGATNSTKTLESVDNKVPNNRQKTLDIQQWEEKVPTVDELKEVLPPYSEVLALKGERGIYLFFDKFIWTLPFDGSFGPTLSDKKLLWNGYDLKSIWHELRLTKVSNPKMDFMLAAYVCFSTAINSFSQIYEQFTGKKFPDFPAGREYVACYKELEPLIIEKLNEVDEKNVLGKIELPLVPVLYEMEKLGICVDVEELNRQSQRIHADLVNLENEIHELAGEKFNISSPKQLGNILFEKLKLPVVKKTKTGYSTGAEVLEKLIPHHPICEKIIEYREYSKLISTYIDVLPKLINPETNRIHSSFKQAVTTTGRLSSVNPNLQNIPIRTEAGKRVRKAFTAPEGKVLLSIDYSQIELRILAHITEDPNLINAFSKDLDIHAATASEIFNVNLELVDSELRRKAKAVNFGIAYGQGAFGLSESLNISRGEAKEIIDNYFLKFKNVKSYMEGIIVTAQRNGFVSTLFGRKRFIKDINSKNGGLRKFAERAAINAPIQGTASDLMKKAMIEIYQSTDARILIQVHDELLFEVGESAVAEKAKELKSVLEKIFPLKVPLKVNIAWGKNWEDAHA